MKTVFIVAAMTIGLIAGLMTGASQAGGPGSENLARIYGADPDVAQVDIGGVTYRVGLDTGP